MVTLFMLHCVFSTTQHSPTCPDVHGALSMLINDSQSIIVGVAMILVLEWVTQGCLCVTDPMHSIYISRTLKPNALRLL